MVTDLTQGSIKKHYIKYLGASLGSALISCIYALSYLLLPLNIYAGYYFQSVMKSKCALICSVMRGMVICSALIFILPAAFGGQTVWFVMPITELVTAVYVIFNMVSLKNAHRT